MVERTGRVAGKVALVSGAASSGTTYLWADAKVPGPNWQARVGSAALSRARNNPF